MIESIREKYERNKPISDGRSIVHNQVFALINMIDAGLTNEGLFSRMISDLVTINSTSGEFSNDARLFIEEYILTCEDNHVIDFLNTVLHDYFQKKTNGNGSAR